MRAQETIKRGMKQVHYAAHADELTYGGKPDWFNRENMTVKRPFQPDFTEGGNKFCISMLLYDCRYTYNTRGGISTLVQANTYGWVVYAPN